MVDITSDTSINTLKAFSIIFIFYYFIAMFLNNKWHSICLMLCFLILTIVSIALYYKSLKMKNEDDNDINKKTVNSYLTFLIINAAFLGASILLYIMKVVLLNKKKTSDKSNSYYKDIIITDENGKIIHKETFRGTTTEYNEKVKELLEFYNKSTNV